MFQNGFSLVKDILMGVGIALATVGAVILGAPALIAGVVAAIVFCSGEPCHSDQRALDGNRNLLSGLWRTSKTLAGTAWQAISDTIGSIVSGIATFLSGIWTSIATTASSIWTAISTTVGDIVQGIVDTNHKYLERICVGFRPAARSIPISI